MLGSYSACYLGFVRPWNKGEKLHVSAIFICPNQYFPIGVHQTESPQYHSELQTSDKVCKASKYAA